MRSTAITAALFACTLWLTATPQTGFSFGIGEAEVRSPFSQPLLVRIPYQLAKGESIEAACVRVLTSSSAASDIPEVVAARPSLQTQGGKNYIVLESPRLINEPAARLSIEVKCGTISSRRNYVLLFDPPEWNSTNAAPGATAAVSSPVVAAPSATPVAPVAEAPAANPPPVIPAPVNPPVAAPQSAAVVSAASPVQMPAPAQALAPARAPVAKPTLPKTATTTTAAAAPVPASPALAKSAATPNPRLPADGKPVLRLEAARDNGGPDNRQNHCCFRLAYELADHGGPALTDEEREKLRQEIRDRLADEDPVARLQSMRIELAALKKQAMAAAAELAAAQARNEQQARDAQATREMVFYAAYMLAAIALGLALWQWLRIKRRRNAEIQQFFAETLATPEPPPAALTTELTPDIPTEGGQETTLDWDLSKDTVVFDVSATPAAALESLAEPDAAVGSLSTDPEKRAAEYQKAYILARFPEVAAGNIILRNPASVIEGARIFYHEDHDAAKAEELLRIAMAGHPEHVNVWLALFEILYLERTAAEFSELARRYRDARDTATDEHWPMIVRLGYKLDPENPLFSTGGPATDEPQPNWLNSELDMMGDALAIELHMQMLARLTPSKPADSNSITYEP